MNSDDHVDEVNKYLRVGWDSEHTRVDTASQSRTYIRWIPAPWAVAILLGVVVAVAIASGMAYSSTPNRPVPSPKTPPSLAAKSIKPPPVSSSQVIVHVVGQVAKPGLVKLPANSRVSDAITQAGGPSPQADLSTINLARIVTDGEQLQVPKVGEEPNNPSVNAATGTAETAKISLNNASAADLETLSGIGPALAQRIVSYRDEHGPFTNCEDLMQVSGIGPKVFERIRDRIRV